MTIRLDRETWVRMTAEQRSAIERHLPDPAANSSDPQADRESGVLGGSFPAPMPDEGLLWLLATLKSERERQGLGLAEVGSMISVPTTDLERLEAGEDPCHPWHVLGAFALALGVRVSWSVERRASGDAPTPGALPPHDPAGPGGVADDEARPGAEASDGYVVAHRHWKAGVEHRERCRAGHLPFVCVRPLADGGAEVAMHMSTAGWALDESAQGAIVDLARRFQLEDYAVDSTGVVADAPSEEKARQLAVALHRIALDCRPAGPRADGGT